VKKLTITVPYHQFVAYKEVDVDNGDGTTTRCYRLIVSQAASWGMPEWE
jgi:hypothetical protein